MFSFIKNNNISPKSLIFVKQAISHIVSDADVDFDDEVILDSSFLTTKAYCVYNELKRTNGNLFRRTIGSFIDYPEYKLYFRVGNCDDPADMCTNDDYLISSNILTIKVDNVNLNGLNNAAALLHEGIHAELFRFVNEANNGNVNPNERERLFDLYRIYKDDLRNLNSNAQHAYMAENYVEPIAKAIRELDNNRYPLEYYMGFGWDGLRDYAYTGLLSDEDSARFEELKNIVLDNTNFNPINCN